MDLGQLACLYTPTVASGAENNINGHDKEANKVSARLDPKSLDFVRAFLHYRHPDKKSVDDALRRSFPLYKHKPPKHKKKGQQKHKRQQLTGADKKRLGLNKVPKKGVKYADFLPIHALWLGYIKELTDLESLNINALSSNMDQFYNSLSKADYLGCLITVVQSKCSSYIGLTGIVILETKNTLQIVTKEDAVKVVPKQHSIFSFRLDQLTIKIYGNHFNTRPTERAARKFKSKTTIEL